MIPRIKNIETASDYKLIVTFDDGILIVSLVFGLIPSLAALFATSKVPKPTN